MRDSGLGTWIVPTLCFLLFLYGMGFVMIYTYNSNFGNALTADKKQRGEIDSEAIKREIMKLKLN